MSTSNGQPADENTFNNAYVSRTTDSDTIGKLDLNNADSANVTDVQQTINDQRTDIDQNRTDIDSNDVELADHESRISTNETDIAQNQVDIANIANDYVDLDSAQNIGGIKTFDDNVIIDGDLEVNGTTTTVNSATLDVTDANVTINNGGTDASSEGAGLTVERVGTDGSIVYEDALDNKFKAGPAGSELELTTIVKDTEANILAIGSPSTSVVYYATDTGARFYYDAIKSDFLELGSGSGVGSPSIYGLFNAEDEDVTGWTGATTTGVSPIAGEFSYALTLPGHAPAVTVQDRSLNKLNQLNLQHKMTSGVIKYIVKDQSSNILVEKEVDEDGTVALQWFMNDTITSIQLFWEDVSSGVGTVIDDVYSDDNPLNFRDTIDVITIAGAGNAGTGITTGVTDVDFIETDDSSGAWSGTVYTVQRSNSILQISGQVQLTSNGARFLQLFKNGAAFKTDISNFPAATTNHGFVFQLTENEVVQGDTLSVRIGVGAAGGSLSNSIVDHYITVVESVSSNNLLTSDSGTRNTFSARIQNNGTATVLNESYPFIDSVNRSALGVVDITFKPGFFTVPPSTLATADIRTVIANVTASSTSSMTVDCQGNTGVGNDNNFSITVERMDDDNKDPHAFNLVQLQDQNENRSGARIANNGTATITSQGANWVQSATRASLGVVNIVFTPGVFSVPPSITITAETTSTGGTSGVSNLTTTGVTITISNDGISLHDKDFGISIKKQGADYIPPSGVSAGPMQAVAVAVIKDVKPNGTVGGTFTTGSWQTRDLNTISGSGFASLSSNQFTLQPGTYEIDASAPAYYVSAHKCKIRNITDASDAIIGQNAYAESAGNGDFTQSRAFDKITITSTKVFEVQHRGGATRASDGFGGSLSFGVDEVYTQVIIRKLR